MKNSSIKKLLLVMLAFALVCTAALNIAPMKKADIAHAEGGNIYYVTADAPTDLSKSEPNNREKPYNINKLLASATILLPGDTVKVIPGDYDILDCITITVSGTYDKYITIENDSDEEQATLSFYRQYFSSTNRGVQIYGNYIHWRDIDVCGAGDNGLYIGGSYNIVEDCEFYNNRDTGLQLGRAYAEYTTISEWPSYNLIKNCTSHNNYDNETYGENADGFAAKLTVGYGNVFDGCIAYRNSDDGWDLYAKTDSGNIGAVIMYNCVTFENGFLEYNQETNNARFKNYRPSYNEAVTTNFTTRDGDGNGFKLGGSVMEGDVVMYNCLSFNNMMHGVTDNSNPGVISIKNVTSYDNGRSIDNNPKSATYGQVTVEDWGESCGNIDVARQTYSYNNLENVLSLKTAGKGLGNDAYRASVQNSILGTASSSTKAYKIEGALDADTKKNIYGKEISAPAAKDVLATIPVDYSSNTYNFSGLKDMDNGANRVHIACRNSDGSINLGNLLAVNDYSKLLGNDNKIGSVLNLSSYESYEHFDLTNDYSGVKSSTEAILKAAKETLTISCNAKAVYQDMWVATNMLGVTIDWSSSDTSVLEVSDQTKTSSTSKASFVYLIAHRDIYEDKQVTLTATINAGDSSVTKEFVLNVKQDLPKIGEIFVVTEDGTKINSVINSVIVDQYAVATEPTISVVNGANYSGLQFVEGSQYTVDSKYEYATSKLSNYVEVNEFTPSNAGVWHITHTVTLISSNEVKSFDYYIYTASPSASVEFASDPALTVNLNGYLISGKLSNVTGVIYAVASKTDINVTKQNIKTLDGVESFVFSDDSISFQFTNDNKSAYYVYFALANMRDEITSEIYKEKIEAVEITNTKNFIKVAGGSAIGSEDVTKTIYKLTTCLDFNGKAWTASSGTFSAYLNGNGHTVSNISYNGAGLFNKVEGGTITNIKFDNIKIDNGSNQKTGLISTVYGGYFDGIELTNIYVEGGQRAGGLIGQIYQSAIPTYVSRVSLVNPIPVINEDGSIDENANDKVYMIKANGNRAGGIIGFIQPSGSGLTENLEVYVSDCFSSSYILTTGYSAGGIVAEYDDTYAATSDVDFVLHIINCYSSAVIVGTGSSSRIGGMLGYQHGGGTLKISGCLSTIQPYFKGLKVDAAQKNISCIVGGFASSGNITVNKCGSVFDEYSTDYGVTTYGENMLKGDYGPSIIKTMLSFDTTNTWSLVYAEGSTKRLAAPYIKLNLDGCNC